MPMWTGMVARPALDLYGEAEKKGNLPGNLPLSIERRVGEQYL